MRRWAAYAAGLRGLDPEAGAGGTNGYLAFSALGRSIMRIDPALPIPAEPPAGRFLGDLVVVTASAPPPAPSSSPDGNGPTAEPSSRGDEKGVLFAADRANAPGVLTELLTQPLANGARRPRANGYRSRGFVAFGGPGSVEVAAGEGWHACATRFVEAATGRTMGLLSCGVVRAA